MRRKKTGTSRVYAQVRHPEHQFRMGRGRGRHRLASDLTTLQWLERIKEFDSHCGYCSGQFPQDELEIEHLIPLSDGGTHVLMNVIPVCRLCNSKRKNTPLHQWLPTLSDPYLLRVPAITGILSALGITLGLK
jgi:5-methylcytosine-specific restriction endonuclease McrA